MTELPNGVPPGAKRAYTGKSKTVYTAEDDCDKVFMVFTDGFTGADGVENPGANQNIGTKEGLGHKNLSMTSYLYDKISEELGILSQIVEVDLENNLMIAKKARPFGKGLEFIARNKAWGSFLQRNSGYKQGDSTLDKKGWPFVEVSEKDDEKGDPFFSKQQHIARGSITTKDWDACVWHTKIITDYLTSVFAEKGLDLIDIKIEFGKDRQGNIMLIDEISPGSLRALRDGKSASKDEIYEAIMGKPKSKSEAIMDNAAGKNGCGAVAPQKKPGQTGRCSGNDGK